MKRFIRLPEVIQRTGLSRSRLYERMREGEFPNQVKLGRSGRAVAWIESEVDAWIDLQIDRREKATVSGGAK